jgi:hypothetical protein
LSPPVGTSIEPLWQTRVANQCRMKAAYQRGHKHQQTLFGWRRRLTRRGRLVRASLNNLNISVDGKVVPRPSERVASASGRQPAPVSTPVPRGRGSTFKGAARTVPTTPFGRELDVGPARAGARCDQEGRAASIDAARCRAYHPSHRERRRLAGWFSRVLGAVQHRCARPSRHHQGVASFGPSALKSAKSPPAHALALARASDF